MNKLFFIISVLITYGSLYPFDFTITDFNSTSFADFLNTSGLFTSVADILGNIILFIPLGIAGIISLKKHSIVQYLVLIFSISLLLALLIQIAQMFIPSRDAALSDVFWNALGTIIGMLIGFLLNQQFFLIKGRFSVNITPPVLLVGLWIFWQLLPFIPSLDIYYLKESVKTFWLQPKLSIPETLYISSTILLLGQLLTITLAGKNISPWLLMLVVLTLLGKIIIISQVLTLSTLTGMILGLASWLILKPAKEDQRNRIIFVCLILSYTLISLEPYDFSSSPGSFNFIPFAGLLDGSMLTNTSALAEKLFAYAGILWLAHTISGQITRWAIALALWVSLLEIIQIFLIGRVASISEPIWVLLAAWLLNTLCQQEYRTSKTNPGARSKQSDYFNRPEKSNTFSINTQWLKSWQLQLLVVCLLIASVINVVINIPGIPYNVSELFYRGGNFTSLVTFSCLLLWFGIASGWLAQIISAKTMAVFTIPLYTIAIGIISYLLLINSVTHESVSDIVGSSNLYKQVVEQQMWGHWAKAIFVELHLASLASSFEQGVRYVALISPVILLFMLAIQFSNKALMVSTKQLTINLFLTIPWLILSKLIVIDWASTDNLLELIALADKFGITGEYYLYLLLLLVCCNASITGIGSTKTGLIIKKGLLTIFALPIGWFLLNQGLEQDIIKYNSVYSGVQFLLGPDRSHSISQAELFFRWSLLYIGFTIILSIGLKFSRPSYQWLKNLSYLDIKATIQNFTANKSLGISSYSHLFTALLIILFCISIFFLSTFFLSTKNQPQQPPTTVDYQLPELAELPEVYLPLFKQQHPRLPAPSLQDIEKLTQQNKPFFNRAKRHAKRGRLYHQILIAYTFPGETDLDELFKKLMSLKFTGRGNVQTMPIALAYDWLYEQWSPEQQLQLKSKVKLACDYQIHIIRDKMELSPYNVFLYNKPLQALVTASLALHKDIPVEDDNCMRFSHDYWTNRVLPVWRQIMGKNGGWHEGGEYIGIGIGKAIYQIPAMWRHATGEDVFTTTPGIKGFLDFLVYRTRPDGTHFRWGDSGLFSVAVPDRIPLAIEFQHKAAFNLKPATKLRPTSWPWGPLTDHKLFDTQANDTLALTKLFDGIGLLVSRTGWDKDATYVTFKAGNNYWSHSHLDQGAFTIFKGGALAIDSGLYGSKYGSDHHMNYTYQSIAHNVVTVTDPDDDLVLPAKKKKNGKQKKKAREIANDGGQRRIGSGWGERAPLDLQDWNNQSDIYNTAIIKKVYEKNNIIVVIADLTLAYTNTLSGKDTFAHRTKRVKNYQRVFIHDKNNDLILIFDQINAFNPDFKKRWLLHSLHEPTISGNFFHLSTPPNAKTKMPGGQLQGQVLLPKKANIQKIGGKGLEYYVDGKNYDDNGKVLKKIKQRKNFETGQWRIELQPQTANKEDIFLVALQPTLLSDNKPFPDIQISRDNNTIFCKINGQASFTFHLNGVNKQITVDF